MGYRQHLDGTWEQPAEAEKRVSLRRVFNTIAASAVIATSALGVSASVYLMADSNVMQDGQTDHDKVLASMGCFFGAAAIALAGGIPMSRRISRDNNALDAIRHDVRDNRIVVDGKAIIAEPSL